jgi:CBS-domain-containing membrane protein
MHPTFIIGTALLSWLVLRNRSATSRVLFAVALLLFGGGPAGAGSRYGWFLVSLGAGSAASVLWEVLAEEVYWRRERRRKASRAATRADRSEPPEGCSAADIDAVVEITQTTHTVLRVVE